MRRHGQDRAGGHDPAAADAGEQAAPDVRRMEQRYRQRQRAANSASRAAIADRRPAPTGGPACVTKLGQKPFRQDRSTLQLVGLIRRLRPSVGFHRLDRDAAGLGRAVAAVLAHRLVDDDMPRRLRHRAALAAAALFGGADLVVDQHRRPS